MAKQLLKERFQQLAGIKPLYELEKENPLLIFLQKNKGEVEKAVGERLTDFEMDDLGDVGSTTSDGFTGYAFRHAKDVDSEFLGAEGYKSITKTIAGAWINYIEYNI